MLCVAECGQHEVEGWCAPGPVFERDDGLAGEHAEAIMGLCAAATGIGEELGGAVDHVVDGHAGEDERGVERRFVAVPAEGSGVDDERGITDDLGQIWFVGRGVGEDGIVIERGEHVTEELFGFFDGAVDDSDTGSTGMCEGERSRPGSTTRAEDHDGQAVGVEPADVGHLVEEGRGVGVGRT